MTKNDFMVFLEDYRHNDLGNSFLILDSKPEHKVFLTYDLHITKAFYTTIQDLGELEDSRNFMIGNGHQTHSSISFWFLGLESFISTLLKICCLKKDINFLDYKNDNLSSRLTTLLELLEVDKIKFYKTGILSKLNELCNFRNELFHDGNFGTRINFIKTNFSETPFLSNQVDTFQTIIILLEIIQNLRFSIEGIDTTPNVILTNHLIGLWESLDSVYTEILKPTFEQILKKHNLAIKLNLETPKIEIFKGTLFQKGEVKVCLRVEQEEKYFIEVNETKSNICNNIFQAFMKEKNMKEKQFRLSNRNL
jgi:hypothetical protein